MDVYAAKMLERDDGYLLNVASGAGLLTEPDSAPNAVTKTAAVSLAEPMRRRWCWAHRSGNAPSRPPDRVR